MLIVIGDVEWISSLKDGYVKNIVGDVVDIVVKRQIC